MKPFHHNAGIAIGPILFIVAMLSIIVAALSSGLGSFGGNATIDRIKSDVRGQANLFRSKIQECYMITMGNENFGYPAGPTPSGVAVKNLQCPGDPAGKQNIWSGARPTAFPVNPQGFNDWIYFNYSDGRCLLLTPSGTASTTMRQGINAVANYFAAREKYIDSSDYSLSIWLTPLDTPKKCGT